MRKEKREKVKKVQKMRKWMDKCGENVERGDKFYDIWTQERQSVRR